MANNLIKWQMTINELISYGVQMLTNSDSPRIDVVRLLTQVLNCQPAFLKAYPEQEISEDEALEFEQILARRIIGEPIAYILGEQAFWNFSVMVSKDVLIPRPETELLVEKALEKIKQYNNSNNCKQPIQNDNKLNILDLGTGSGAIAIALALELPTTHVLATDLSSTALDIAKANAKTNNANNISFYHGDLFTPLPNLLGKFACIVSNPPYIAQNDPHLNNTNLKFEPQQALIAGREGLDVLKAIIAGAQEFLTQKGWLLVEHGYDQACKVQELFTQNNYGDIASYKDLSGYVRVTGGCKL